MDMIGIAVFCIDWELVVAALDPSITHIRLRVLSKFREPQLGVVIPKGSSQCPLDLVSA